MPEGGMVDGQISGQETTPARHFLDLSTDDQVPEDQYLDESQIGGMVGLPDYVDPADGTPGTGGSGMLASTYDPAGIAQQVVGTTAAQELSAKRIVPRSTGTAGPGATPSYDVDNFDIFRWLSLSTAITSMVTNATGTPTDGQVMTHVFSDNGTARAITWGAAFASQNATLPTSTIVGHYTYVVLVFNANTLVWDCIVATTSQSSWFDIQVFTTPGAFTWTKPTSFTPKAYKVISLGGGGQGGCGCKESAGTAAFGGGPGGAGAYAVADFDASDLPSATYAGSVATGGSTSTGLTTNGIGATGQTGSASWFGNSAFASAFVLAEGGVGGTGGTTTANGTTGASSSATHAAGSYTAIGGTGGSISASFTVGQPTAGAAPGQNLAATTGTAGVSSGTAGVGGTAGGLGPNLSSTSSTGGGGGGSGHNANGANGGGGGVGSGGGGGGGCAAGGTSKAGDGGPGGNGIVIVFSFG